MKRGNVIFLFALFPLVPVSGNLAYAAVVSLGLLWFFASGLVFRFIVARVDLGTAGPAAELVGLGGAAAIYLQLLRFYSPILALALGFYVFLSAFTFLLLVSIDGFGAGKSHHVPVIRFIPFFIAFSALREILSFGSLSLPVREGLLSFSIPYLGEAYRLGFWGTSGGALILLGTITWLFKFLNRRTSSYRRNHP